MTSFGDASAQQLWPIRNAATTPPPVLIASRTTWRAASRTASPQRQGTQLMAKDRSHDTTLGNHQLRPETLMLSYGYDPALSEGSAKPPVFLTSTFVFRSAEEGA